jgi:hypothetical protein
MIVTSRGHVWDGSDCGMAARLPALRCSPFPFDDRAAMLMSPSITVSNIGEPIKDELGQQWSAATVSIAWPPPSELMTQLEPPAMQIRVIAAYRPEMTVEELRHSHLAAALDVLSSALLALEQPVQTEQDNQSVASSPPRSVSERR